MTAPPPFRADLIQEARRRSEATARTVDVLDSLPVAELSDSELLFQFVRTFGWLVDYAGPLDVLRGGEV